MSDTDYMREALALARRAESEGEVPVGALVVKQGQIVGEGWNRNIALHDPSAHAEILSLRKAGEHLGNHRLSGCTLYVTLEPCAMCLVACIHARIDRLVFGAADPKTGAVGGRYDLLSAVHHNHELLVSGGIREKESARLLKAFFRARRT